MTTTATERPVISVTAERTIHIERTFNAPRDRVWKALTDPTLLAQWWGRGNKLVIERMELHRGGHWRFVEHSDHGVHGFEGRYREVTAPERIVRSFEWDGMPGYVIIETIQLVELPEGRTRIVTDSLFHTTEERDGFLQSGVEGGLTRSYAELDKVLARMS
jgi:uncharacterized protein YndB with AHSA1/START domain